MQMIYWATENGFFLKDHNAYYQAAKHKSFSHT